MTPGDEDQATHPRPGRPQSPPGILARQHRVGWTRRRRARRVQEQGRRPEFLLRGEHPGTVRGSPPAGFQRSQTLDETAPQQRRQPGRRRGAGSLSEHSPSRARQRGTPPTPARADRSRGCPAERFSDHREPMQHAPQPGQPSSPAGKTHPGGPVLRRSSRRLVGKARWGQRQPATQNARHEAPAGSSRRTVRSAPPLR